MMRAAKSSRAWIGALALVVAMAYSSDRAHVVHAVRFADKAKVFGLASNSGFLRGDGSGGLVEETGVVPVLPAVVYESLLGYDEDGVLTAATSPTISGTLTASAISTHSIELNGAGDTVTSDIVAAVQVKGAYFEQNSGFSYVQLAGKTGGTAGSYVVVGTLGTQSDAGTSVAFGRSSSVGVDGVALGFGAAASGEGTLALGRLAKSRIAGTVRTTAPPIVSRGGAGESTGSGHTMGVIGTLRTFASSQTVLACEPVSVITGGSATIAIPAGARFIPLLALAWVSELSGGDGLRGGSIGDGYAYVVSFGTSAAGTEITELALGTNASLATLGGVVTTQPSAHGTRFTGIVGSVHITAPAASFGPVGTPFTPTAASVRAALVGILVEREATDSG